MSKRIAPRKRYERSGLTFTVRTMHDSESDHSVALYFGDERLVELHCVLGVWIEAYWNGDAYQWESDDARGVDVSYRKTVSRNLEGIARDGCQRRYRTVGHWITKHPDLLDEIWEQERTRQLYARVAAHRARQIAAKGARRQS